MDEPVWIDKPETLIAHCRQLAEHGGSDDIRDESLLESALAKPRNVFAYEDATLPRLAASYAFGMARNHAFVDGGNKRTSLVVSLGFLRLNGLDVTASHEERYATFLSLAEGSLTEEELTLWFTLHSVVL